MLLLQSFLMPLSYYFRFSPSSFFFFFNDTATTEIYTLSLHDALPISKRPKEVAEPQTVPPNRLEDMAEQDRKSTRLNSSHTVISYAVFCLKKKKKKHTQLKTRNQTINIEQQDSNNSKKTRARLRQDTQ